MFAARSCNSGRGRRFKAERDSGSLTAFLIDNLPKSKPMHLDSRFVTLLLVHSKGVYSSGRIIKGALRSS